MCAKSSFFSSHEFIGSSLLFVSDESRASVWMIDFEKTREYEGKLHHDTQWVSPANNRLSKCFFIFGVNVGFLRVIFIRKGRKKHELSIQF